MAKTIVLVICLMAAASPMLQAGPAAAAEIPEVKEGQKSDRLDQLGL